MSIIKIKKQKGLSFIELLVATLISMLLLIGVLQVFISSKNVYNTSTALARTQENGRFAAEFLAFDIRNAGFKGECLSNPVLRVNISDPELIRAYLPTPPLQGWEGTKPSIMETAETIRSNTDSIIIKYAGGGGSFTAKSSNQVHTPSLGVNESHGAYAGQIVFVSSSGGCDIFQSTNNANANALQQSGGNVQPGNKNCGSGGSSSPNYQCWSQAYSGPISLYTLQSNLYFIRDNGDGRLPSLYRKRLGKTSTTSVGWMSAEELVEGVLDMQIVYGVDSDGDRRANLYSKADSITDWEKVVSTRIELLVASPEINAVDKPQTIAFPAATGITKEDEFAKYVDGTVTIKQNRIAKIFTTTVGIRNRLP